MKKINYVDLYKQNHKIYKKIFLKVFDKVYKSGNYILGKNVFNLERKISKLVGTKYAVGVGSGTDALYLCLKFLNLKKTDEVITVANSYLATASTVKLNNLKIKFAEVCTKTLNIDLEDLKKKISKKTKVIICVHLMGRPCEIQELKKICKKKSIILIEDCAQAIGSKFKNRHVGSFGDFSCFSFHPLKNIGTFGDGGIICTNNRKAYNWLLKARNSGHSSRDECDFISFNMRLDELHAAFILEKLKKLNKVIKLRRENANIYRAMLPDQIELIKEDKRIYETHHLFIARVKNREKLINFLRKKRIDTKVHYPIPIHKMKAFKKYNYKLKKTETLSKQIISLPVNESISPDDIIYICKKIKQFYKK